MKQPILVLDANGFIGRSVVSALAATDWAEAVAGLSRDGPVPPGAAKRCVIHAADAASIGAALQGMSAVVNCAAPGAGGVVPSVRALFDAVRAVDPAIRVMYLSSMSVYGSATGLVDESAALRGDLGAYSAAKMAAEAIAASHPRTVIFRQGIVYGPGSAQWSLRFAQYLRAHRLGDLGVAGDGYCNLVHVDDVAAAMVRALENPHTDGRSYNLASPDPPTWNEYMVRYARALRAVPVRRISDRRLKIETKVLAVPLKIGELAARACRLNPEWIPPAIPPSLGQLMRQEIRLSTARAEAELGLHWRDLDSGLQQSARWFLESRSAA